MFNRKPKGWKEGTYVFSSKKNGNYKDFFFGMITGVDGNKIGINGLIINPVGLKNKVEQKKAGIRSVEILNNPTPENCIFALIYRIEYENFTTVIDVKQEQIHMISPISYAVFDGWVREDIPELLNNILSLPVGAQRDAAKITIKQKMDTLLDKELRRSLYSICRSLKILSGQE